MAWCRLSWLTRAQLVLDGHNIEAVALPLLLLPAGASHSQLFQEPTVELFEFVFGALVNDDPVSTAADDLVDGNLPGAQHPFTQQWHTQSPHHQGGQFTGFDVEREAQDSAELLP